MKTDSNLMLEEAIAVLQEGKNVSLYIRGNSMFPFLRDGKDILELCPPGDRALGRGDVVLFRYGGKLLLHRIIALRGEYFIMQGDGCWQNKEKAVRSDIFAILFAVRYPDGRIRHCQSFTWRFYSALWFHFRFIRRYVLAVLRRI